MQNRISMKGNISMNNPRLGWVRWKNPFFLKNDDGDDIEGNTNIFDNNEDDEDNEYEDNSPIKGGNMKVVVTPMGAIPLIEQSSPNKVFNLWVAHTNFNITQEVAKIVENTEGVETLDVFSRYRMRVGIGRMFNPKETMYKINNNILQVLAPTSGVSNDKSTKT